MTGRENTHQINCSIAILVDMFVRTGSFLLLAGDALGSRDFGFRKEVHRFECGVVGAKDRGCKGSKQQ